MKTNKYDQITAKLLELPPRAAIARATEAAP